MDVSVRDDSAEAAAARLRRIESEALWHRHREEYRWALPPPARLFWRLPVIRHIRCAWRDYRAEKVHRELQSRGAPGAIGVRHTKKLPLTAATGSSGTVSSVRFEFIDGLRGIAILLVLLRHYYMDTYIPGLPRWFDTLGLGYLGVHLFLLLSGFCIAWPYIGPLRRQFTVRDFLNRRATRILPAYYVALFIALILALPLDSQEMIRQITTHLTMTHNLSISTVLALNEPFWSLALEFQLYLLFPLMFWADRRFGLLWMLLSVLLLQTCFRTYVALNYGTQYSDMTFVLPWSVAGRMFDFALGVFAARVLAEPSYLQIAERWFIKIGILSVLFLGGAIISKRYFGETSPVTDLLWSCAFLSLLLVAGLPNTVVNRVISFRPLVQLGIISYSVYLVHALILKYLTAPVRGLQSATLVVALTLPTLLVTIACCYGFYRAAEKPAVDFFGNRRKRVVGRADANVTGRT